MKRLILKVKDKSKLPFLKELLSYMDFVEIVKPKKFTAKEKQILADLEYAVEQVNLHNKGRIKLKTLQQASKKS